MVTGVAKCAGVLGAVQGQAFGGRRDAASLDRSSARRRVDVWVGTKKRLPGRTKKLSDEKVDSTEIREPLRRAVTEKVSLRNSGSD